MNNKGLKTKGVIPTSIMVIVIMVFAALIAVAAVIGCISTATSYYGNAGVGFVVLFSGLLSAILLLSVAKILELLEAIAISTGWKEESVIDTVHKPARPAGVAPMTGMQQMPPMQQAPVQPAPAAPVQPAPVAPAAPVQPAPVQPAPVAPVQPAAAVPEFKPEPVAPVAPVEPVVQEIKAEPVAPAVVEAVPVEAAAKPVEAVAPAPPAQSGDIDFDELKRLRELVDMNIISEEEFVREKKRILGL